MMNNLFAILHALPLPLLFLLFLLSLAITIGASAWFTYRLEAVSNIFDLSPGLLSLLGALGANIPNYVASIVAIATGQLTTGLGIIIGSNIYNIAIILALATFATPGTHGITLKERAIHDIQSVALYTVFILVLTQFLLLLLSLVPTHSTIALPINLSLIVFALISLVIFCLLGSHALRRVPHLDPEQDLATTPAAAQYVRRNPLPTPIIIITEVILALSIALFGVIIMVNTSQNIATQIHLPQVLLGLIILAIATSLPNTVVAFSLARTHRATACIEEVFSSNSINATLGIALPLLIWRAPLHDALLLWLDTPLMILLTATTLLCVRNKRISHPTGILLLLTYLAWVGIHLLL